MPPLTWRPARLDCPDGHDARETREQLVFCRDFNRRGSVLARGARMVPYPHAEDVFIWSTVDGDRHHGFGDLNLQDYVMAHKRVAHHLLPGIVCGKYLTTLLERGIQHKMDVEESDTRVNACLGYAGAIGVELSYHMAWLSNEVSPILVSCLYLVSNLPTDAQP